MLEKLRYPYTGHGGGLEWESNRRRRHSTTGNVSCIYTGVLLNSPFSDEIQSSTYYARVRTCVVTFSSNPHSTLTPPMQPSTAHMAYIVCSSRERNCIREGAPFLPRSPLRFTSLRFIFDSRFASRPSRLTTSSRKMSLWRGVSAAFDRSLRHTQKRVLLKGGRTVWRA